MNRKIAFIKTHTWENAKKYVKDEVNSFIKIISAEKDIEIYEINEPYQLRSSHEIHSTIYDKALAYYFKEEFKNKELISQVIYDIIDHGNDISQEEYEDAINQQSEITKPWTIYLLIMMLLFQ